MDPITALKCPRCGKMYYDNGHGICNACYRDEVDHPIPYSQIKKQQEGNETDIIEEAEVKSQDSAADDIYESSDEISLADISDETFERLAGEPIYETKAKAYSAQTEETTSEDDSDMKVFEPVISNKPNFEYIPMEDDNKKKKKAKGKGKKLLAVLITFLLIIALLAVGALGVYYKVYLPKVEGYNNALKYEESKEYIKAFDEFSLIKDYKDSNMHIVSSVQAMVDSNDFENVYACIEKDNTLPSKLKIKEKNLYDLYAFLDEKLLTILNEDRPKMMEDINLFNKIVRDMIPSQYDRYDDYFKVCSSVKESDAYSPQDDYLFYMNIADHISSYIQSGKSHGIFVDILESDKFIEFFLSAETPEKRLPQDKEIKSNCYWSDTEGTYNVNKITLSKDKKEDKKYTYELDGRFFENNVDGYENTSFIIQNGNFYSPDKNEEFSISIKNYYVIELKSIKNGESIELTRKI